MALIGSLFLSSDGHGNHSGKDVPLPMWGRFLSLEGKLTIRQISHFYHGAHLGSKDIKWIVLMIIIISNKAVNSRW